MTSLTPSPMPKHFNLLQLVIKTKPEVKAEMVQSLSNITISLPLSSGSKLLNPTTTVVKAKAGELRENLDHLQRATNTKHKKRLAPVAPIGLWDRFPTARTVQQMMDTMESLMDDPFEWSSPQAAAPSSGGEYSRGRTPWEIKEGEADYKMRFDMPGMTKEDVKVWVEEKMLVLKAEKVPNKNKGAQENGAAEAEQVEEEWSSKSYGRYSCRIALPEYVEFEKIQAEVRDGVLYISIPKATRVGKVLDINVM